MANTEKTLNRIMNKGLRHGDKGKIFSELNALEMFWKRQKEGEQETKKINFLKRVLK